jgi:hypothetical protein
MLPQQNEKYRYRQLKILLLSTTPLFALNSTASGNTVYKLPLGAWREAVWHEAVLQ